MMAVVRTCPMKGGVSCRWACPQFAKKATLDFGKATGEWYYRNPWSHPAGGRFCRSTWVRLPSP